MNKSELTDLVERCSATHGAHVIDLSVRGDRQVRVIEVFVDAEVGVTTELCSTISRDVVHDLDQSGLIRERYRLEVSSPGIERPLKFSWQYPKHIGRKVAFRVRQENGVESRLGTLVGIDEDGITLEGDPAGTTVQLRFDSIVEARVKSPW